MEISTIIAIITAALAVSEALALIPGIKSNSLFQIIYFFLKAIFKAIKNKEA